MTPTPGPHPHRPHRPRPASLPGTGSQGQVPGQRHLRSRSGPRSRTGNRNERGSITLELAVLTPGLLALLALAIVAGRYEIAAGAVENASAAAARAASLARSSAAADHAARQAATASLSQQNLHCTTVTVEVAAGTAPAGQPAQVAVTVRCRLDLASLTVPGLPGGKEISGRTVSVLDTYRSTS